MQQVICFGEILWDKFPDGKKPGGAPMNVALHLHKQGIDSRLISRIGNDNDGKELKEYLQRNRLDTSLIQIHPQLPTGVVQVSLDELQQAAYTIVEPVAWDEIEHHPLLDSITANADALIYGSLAARSEVSRNTLRKLLKKARFKVFDMNLRPPHFENEFLREEIAACDMLKINEQELDYLGSLYNLAAETEEGRLRHLGKITGIETICVTLGSEGAILLHQGAVYRHGAYEVVVADTVGAGDAFLATFVGSYLQKYPIAQALARACAAGALVASKHGANPEYAAEDILAMCQC